MKIYILFLFITLILISGCTLFSCRRDDGLDRFKNTPNTVSLLGNYRPDTKTKKLIEGFNHSDNTLITLLENGDLKFSRFPKGTFDFDAYYEHQIIYTNGSGKWRSGYDDNNSTAYLSVSLKFDDPLIEGQTFEQFGTTYNLYQQDGKYVILIPVGDPDECSSVRLVHE